MASPSNTSSFTAAVAALSCLQHKDNDDRSVTPLTRRRRHLFQRRNNVGRSISNIRQRKQKQWLFLVLIFSTILIFLHQTPPQHPTLLFLVEAASSSPGTSSSSSSSSTTTSNKQQIKLSGTSRMIANAAATAATTIPSISTPSSQSPTTTTSANNVVAEEGAVISPLLIDSCITHSSDSPLANVISSVGNEGKVAGTKTNEKDTNNSALASLAKDMNSTVSSLGDDDGVIVQENEKQSTIKSTNTANAHNSDKDENDKTMSSSSSLDHKSAATAFIGKKKSRSSSSSTSNEKKNKKKVSHEVSTTLRRLQNEWKDIVSAGMAYDWVKGEPRRSRRRRNGSKNNNTTSTSTSTTATLPQQQHLYVGPLGKSLLIWHFSFKGLDGTAYEQGIYHGRIILPKSYPAQPPRVQVWTPSGRFQTGGVDICLSASRYHPETWSVSSWTIRTLLESLRLHMTTTAQEIGGLQASYERRLQYAGESRNWKCLLPVSSSRDYNNNQHHHPVYVDHARMIDQGLFGSINDDETTTIEDEQEELSPLTCPTVLTNEAVTTNSSSSSRELEEEEEEREALSLQHAQDEEDQKVAAIAAALVEKTTRKKTTTKRRRKRSPCSSMTETVRKRLVPAGRCANAGDADDDLTNVLRRQHPRLASSVVVAATKKQKRAVAAAPSTAAIVQYHLERLFQDHGADLRVITIVGFLILFLILNVK